MMNEEKTVNPVHRVYMRDWYFNAGIVGFLEILLTDEEKNKIISNNDEEVFSLRKGKIVIEDNYIEFEASVLKDNGNFAHLMFQKAFDNYGRYKKYIKKLENVIELIYQYLDEVSLDIKAEKGKKILTNWENKGAYSLLEKKYFELFNTHINLQFKIEFSRNIKKEKEFKSFSINDLIEKIEVLELFKSDNNNILRKELIRLVVELKEKNMVKDKSKKVKLSYSKNWEIINNEKVQKTILRNWGIFHEEYKNKYNEIYLNDREYFTLIIKKIENLIRTLKENKFYNDFFENDVQYYISSYFANEKSSIQKQSGFLNSSVKGAKKDHFFNNVINPIILRKVKYEGEGRGKKRILFKSILDINKNASSTYNSGLISFIGSTGAENYKWLNSGSLYIDEISELLSWSSFAGFTDISKGKNFRFLFANQDSSVVDLFRANQSLKSEFIDQKRDDHPYVRYLKNLIESETKISKQALLNTTIIDVDNTSGFYVRIHTLNISKEKINFIIEKQIELSILSKTSYLNLINVYQNLGEVTLNKILKNNLNYNDLNILIRLHLNNNKNSYLRSKLQVLNSLIADYKQTFYGGFKMDGKLSSVYSHGKYLASIVTDRNDGNKIRGYVAKFLNYMKSEDIGDFMNLFMRIHMAYGVKTPYEIKNIFEDKGTFESIGYSFINGLLNVNNKESEKNNDKKPLGK